MLALILACVLVVLVLGGLWLYTTKQHLENDIYSSDIQDSRHMAESVTMYLNDITSSANVISNSPDTAISLKENNTGRLAQISDTLLTDFPRPDGVVITNNDGQIIYGSKPTNLTNITRFYWYDDMSKSDKPYITGLYLSPPLNDYAFAILTPIRENNTTLGRVMVVFTQENFQDSLKEHNLDPRDNIIVVDRYGDVISSNDLTAVNRNTDISSFTPVQKVINGESGWIAHSDSWDGQPRISAYRHIADSGWGVIVSTPMSVEYKPLYDQMAWIIGVLAFFIVVFSLGGYFVSEYLTRPIVGLSKTMQKISEGDHDLRVGIDRKDEIGELAATFNSMMDRLEESKAQSDMYLDLMGHDINNMNQVALGYLEMADSLIKSGEVLGANNEALIKKPIAALEDSTTLIENVGKLQKMKTGELQTKAINITEILQSLKEQYYRIPERDITVNLKSGPKCSVMANELVKDVFANLLWNAIKHSAADKPLTIDIGISNDLADGKRYCTVTIEDNGPGINDDIKGRLFSRFSRGETKAKGSGLGLYLVKTLVEGYHGKIWVEDRVPGDHTQGVKFIVMLPSAIE